MLGTVKAGESSLYFSLPAPSCSFDVPPFAMAAGFDLLHHIDNCIGFAEAVLRNFLFLWRLFSVFKCILLESVNVSGRFSSGNQRIAWLVSVEMRYVHWDSFERLVDKISQ